MSVEGEKRTAAESRGPGSAMHRNHLLQLHLLTADRPENMTEEGIEKRMWEEREREK